MKHVTVVGIGLGGDTVTPEARRTIERAEVITGAPKITDAFRAAGKKIFPFYQAREIAAMIEKEDADEFAVLVSGDTGFYSAASGLAEALKDFNPHFIPGISTVNAFFARLRIPWQDAAFVSAHGRGMNLADYVRRNRLTFCLTGNNIRELGADLSGAGLGHIKTHVGENLGAEEEKIYELNARDLTEGSFPSMTVLLFVNERFDDSTPTGIQDENFARLAGVPMTKSEVRAIVLSKLRLRPNEVCWDIGAGTGSVSVEMALSAYRGHVYAVETKAEAIPLIRQNCAAFHLGNVSAVCGEAPAALHELPAPDAAFIGGSGGQLGEIIDAVFEKNPNARLVMTAVTLETVSAALSAFKDVGIEPEIAQISAVRSKKLGGFYMPEAQNPVTIFSAGGRQS